MRVDSGACGEVNPDSSGHSDDRSPDIPVAHSQGRVDCVGDAGSGMTGPTDTPRKSGIQAVLCE